MDESTTQAQKLQPLQTECHECGECTVWKHSCCPVCAEATMLHREQCDALANTLATFLSEAAEAAAADAEDMLADDLPSEQFIQVALLEAFGGALTYDSTGRRLLEATLAAALTCHLHEITVIAEDVHAHCVKVASQ